MKSDFREAIHKIELEIFTNADRNTVSFMLNQDTIELLSLFNANNEEKTLIPNLSMGEMILCADKWVGYTTSESTIKSIENSGKKNDNILINADFLNADIEEKYESIVLFPPFGTHTSHERNEVAYIKKSLKLLSKNGRLLALVPRNITMAPAFRELREMILCSFNLKAVLNVQRVRRAANGEYSLLIIENTQQEEKIFMSLENDQSTYTIFENFKKGIGGFYVNSIDVYDRIDPNYFDPKFKESRELIQRRDTVKLDELAYVFTGLMIPAPERKENGDYLVIKPQYITGGQVRLGNEKKVFCSKEFVDKEQRNHKCILRTGDVVVSLIGAINWGIYTGDENFAVANQNVAIIRGREDTENWLKLFFDTRTGIEYLESQLKFFSHCGTYRHISIRNLLAMSVPDMKMMKITNSVTQGANFETRVASLFSNIGWDVKEDYKKDSNSFDLALFYHNELRSVVETKIYQAENIKNNPRFLAQLETIKKCVGDVNVYLFVDENIYEYEDGILEELTELPRPEKTREEKKVEKHKTEESIFIKQISLEESSLTDKFLLEILSGIHRIEGKVDNIVEKIEALSKQISCYQSLVDKQLDMAISEEEEERILHAFSEECTEKIIREVSAKDTNRDYNIELQKLILSFGDITWDKMENSSKTFLVSSKVMFNNLISMQDIVDYSGVCLLVTKALEVEMSKRFCNNFLTYLKEKYPGKANYALFPSILLDKYGKPIKPKHFTLGSIAYVLCYLKPENITENQYENNKTRLLEYCSEKLFIGKSDDKIMELLNYYAEAIEEVKNDYRNPSAHTRELKRMDAEECFNLLIDVEKLLKCMLDSFDE